MLYWLLVLGNIIGGFMAASSVLIEKIPELEKVAESLGKVKKYIGAVILIISILNIFNFWTPSYPKLLLLGGLAVGYVLSIDWLEKFPIPEKTQDVMVNIAQKMQIPAGIFALLVGTLKILAGVLHIIEFIL
jgi:uncharacterized membrane protein YkgB